MLPESMQQGNIVLKIARAAIAQAVHMQSESIGAEVNQPWLLQPGASFVTLLQHGQLRGCIGSLQPYLPLLEDIRRNAVSAALHDSRFLPLTKCEFSSVEIEVSILSDLNRIDFKDETDAIEQMRPKIDGIVLEYQSCRSTFLPQVWDSIPDPQQFLKNLKIKAQLPGDFWAEGIRLFRYTVSKWQEIKPLEEN